MKKILSFLLLFLLTITLAGCEFEFEGTKQKTTVHINPVATVTNGIDVEQAVENIYKEVYERIYNEIREELIEELRKELIEQGGLSINDLQEQIYHVIENDIDCNTIVTAYGYNENGELDSGKTGTGVIYKYDEAKDEYYLFTNHHVIEESSKYTVQFKDKSNAELELIGSDATVDIAVLKFKANGRLFKVAKIGDSSKLKKGTLVLAVGNPKGQNFFASVTLGIVGGVDRYVTLNGVTQMFVNYIQHDAAINPGNSGGGLFNLNGEVIGVNVLKYTETEVEGMGFSIPINLAMQVIDEIERTGTYNGKPALGITYSDISTMGEDAKKEYGITEYTKGFYIIEIVSGSSCDGTLQAGDILTEFDGHVIESTDAFIEIFASYRAGNVIDIKYLRNGEEHTATITLKKAK